MRVRHRGFKLYPRSLHEFFMAFRIHFPGAAAHRHSHRIEVQLESLQQFFNSMDPAPFYEKDLDPDAEEYILSGTEEYPLREPVKLILHLEKGGTEQERAAVEQAVHNHFGNQARLARLEFRRLMRLGSRSLAIGVTVLAASLLLGEMLAKQHNALMDVLRQSLLIGGWVAMWQLMQIYLYGWWPLRRRRRVFEKMSRMPVEIRTASRAPAAHPASSP
jgi:hypothetical protein